MLWIILIAVLIIAIILVARYRKHHAIQTPQPRTEPTFSNTPVEIDPEEPEPIDAKKIPQDFIVMRVIAEQNQLYQGYELLQALLANGFRYGAMHIFHRHEQQNGSGKILFSLASATEPGTFDLENMGQTACKGLTLFLQFKDQNNLTRAFELMLETAKQLTEDLGGKILDYNNQRINNQIINNWRKQIQNFEESRYSYDLFD